MDEQEMDAYMKGAAALLALPIPAGCEPGVLANLMRMQAIAQPLLQFPLGEDVEPAPRFEP
jgi:hypothetical protein